ncbi:CPBP family intramembrane glutamic endopeptidase [Chitinophaga sancti]|uniref:CPBP family intramembrane glutamic endopeptidase n=1 Tax=Chitinophaga sancti TaxID=1004 RepID=UPI002A762972|nr:CPBP family intramembrane glutamic endopeptidase [Chitinophaga sancti]WPQ62741.1 CPBP family intramembrane glutamic endopeptidase [Chitinophaga sancti]
MTQQQNPRKTIVIFLLITFAISSFFYAFIIHTGKIMGGRGVFVTGMMWSPALSAFLTSLIIKRPISAMPWKWGEARYQLWSYLVPLLYSLAGYLIIWTVGWGKFYDPAFVGGVAESFGLEKLPKGFVIALYILLTASISMVRSVSSALGEEIGWRGFLVPEMYKVMGYTKTCLITGCIWALWHLPILLFADYNSGTPAWYGFSCFSMLVISGSFIFTWFSLKSGSLWTAVLLHASHNLFIQAIFTPLTLTSDKTKYYYDEFGIVIPILSVLVAIYLWNRRGELPAPK